MQPTLHGSKDYGIGDKVLVNKFVYDYGSPSRWDVIVFDHPLKTIKCAHCGLTLTDNFDPNRQKGSVPEPLCRQENCYNSSPRYEFVNKECIKRCVGLPGDEISTRDGNIVIWDHQHQTWKSPQKPIATQNELWVRAWDSHKKDHHPEQWWTGSSSTLQELRQHPLLINPTNKPLTFNNALSLSGYGDQGKPSPLNAPPCGDIALDLEFMQSPKQGFMVLDIARNQVSHRAEIDFYSKSINIFFGSKWLGKAIYQDENESIHQLRFSRLDGSVKLSLNQRHWDWIIPHFEANQLTQTILAKITLRGSSVALNRLQVLRDIYYDNGNYPYFSGPRKSLKLNAKEYFAMGDNPIWSQDSRIWGPVREEKLIGKALMVLFPLGRTKLIH